MRPPWAAGIAGADAVAALAGTLQPGRGDDYRSANVETAARTAEAAQAGGVERITGAPGPDRGRLRRDRPSRGDRAGQRQAEDRAALHRRRRDRTGRPLARVAPLARFEIPAMRA
jgi:hypothetical protein